MVRRWRGLVCVVFLLLAWAGCSGKSSDDDEHASAGHGGTAAGKGGGAGTGGTSAGEAGEPASGARGGAGGASTGGTGFGGTGTGGVGFGGAGFGGAGFGGTGGTFAGTSGSAGAGGSSGSSSVPLQWSCARTAWHDGHCDCGCGAIDELDCKKDDLDHCDVCDSVGSCSSWACPGRIDPNDVAHCEPTPAGWTCLTTEYHDGTYCDCGCGVPDPDCDDDTAASCDRCSDFGSCAGGACPSSIDPDDNTTCSIPDAWACSPFEYGDGVCTCGCGALDIDCASSDPSDCEECPGDSCSPFACAGTLDPENNAVCMKPPYGWRCAERFYNDGTRCDCGCGVHDPDCDSIKGSACDSCDTSGSCSHQACPSIINPDRNSECVQPKPPADWKCYPYLYADGYSCDCGCGVLDPDCRGNGPAACDTCIGCSLYTCPGSIDPGDITQCAPPPETWTCDVERYLDGYCDCGCGAPDPDCATGVTSNYCFRCPEEGCSGGHCDRIVGTDNTRCTFEIPEAWTCDRADYGDSACDCGCGVIDRDCADETSASCEFCDAPGSCSTKKCPDSNIDPADNSQCLP